MSPSTLGIEETLIRVQTAYPRIYLACHSRHQNARTTPDRLSQRDASLLAHLNEQRPIAQGELARHMGVAKSTLSEALSEMEQHGMVIRQADRQDGRGALILRTEKGTKAMSNGSVLESARLRSILERLSPDERCRVVEGLELIVRASEGINSNAGQD